MPNGRTAEVVSRRAALTPETLEFVLVAFEGPDAYSLAGGLGVRMREFSRAAASLGYATTLAFVGDPELPAEEWRDGVRLLRWCQPLSRHNPVGVYQAEEAKIVDLETTLPGHLVEAVIAPAIERGRLVAVMTEEWQTADFTRVLSDELYRRGLRDRCVMLWNANNSYGFERIDWDTLGYVAEITTVSRYMRHLMWRWGVNPLVVPNGIPEAALAEVDAGEVRSLRDAARSPCLAVKVGRFCPDKRWHQAIDALASLRARGLPARLLMRGGVEGYGGEVIAHCHRRGLEVADHTGAVDTATVASALDATSAPVVNLLGFLEPPVASTLYAAADAVLANSAHEPFGLVGLEAMAAGGVAVVGSTGEEYSRPWVNSLAVTTDRGEEVADALLGLHHQPELGARMRLAARRDAAEMTWPRVIEALAARLGYISEHQGASPPRG
ncbi:MAG TPA: glycosyltransferase family 4 protein [Candidatus Dormibacteraeota bacterium]|nr:glycosyltransferase family 4 protein [Candidatus Dormibacteraeota bacterium]